MKKIIIVLATTFFYNVSCMEQQQQLPVTPVKVIPVKRAREQVPHEDVTPLSKLRAYAALKSFKATIKDLAKKIGQGEELTNDDFEQVIRIKTDFEGKKYIPAGADFTKIEFEHARLAPAVQGLFEKLLNAIIERMRITQAEASQNDLNSDQLDDLNLRAATGLEVLGKLETVTRNEPQYEGQINEIHELITSILHHLS